MTRSSRVILDGRQPLGSAAYGNDVEYLKSLYIGCNSIKHSKRSGEFYLDREVQKKHIGGLFMSEGSYTKNSESEVNELTKRLHDQVDV